jgi:hypothetical protein
MSTSSAAPQLAGKRTTHPTNTLQELHILREHTKHRRTSWFAKAFTCCSYCCCPGAPANFPLRCSLLTNAFTSRVQLYMVLLLTLELPCTDCHAAPAAVCGGACGTAAAAAAAAAAPCSIIPPCPASNPTGCTMHCTSAVHHVKAAAVGSCQQDLALLPQLQQCKC